MNSPRVVYTFRNDSNCYPMMTMIKTAAPARRGQSPTTSLHTIFLTTYNRFVRLANSGRYRIMIQAGDQIAWELWVER